MSRSFKNTSGGKQISGGTLSPRQNRPNSTFQVDSWRRGGSTPILVDYLLIGGGGSGTQNYDRASGGGGAGGVLSTMTATGGGGALEPKISLLPGTTYLIVVGGSDTNSTFGGRTAFKGGPGQNGQYNNQDPTTEYGSGGGSGAVEQPRTNKTFWTATQGHSGANGYGFFAAGSGGGAGSAASNGSGGNGQTIAITGSNVVYGGGGAASGRADAGGPDGSPGSGGGGGVASSGTNGLGGGGGSATIISGHGAAGSGGSGRCIIRAPQAASSTTGSPTVTTVGGDYVYDFIGSGSITF